MARQATSPPHRRGALPAAAMPPTPPAAPRALPPRHRLRRGQGTDWTLDGRRRRRRGSGWPRALDPRWRSLEVVSPCPRGPWPGDVNVAPSNASPGGAGGMWAVMTLQLARGGQGRSRAGVPVPGAMAARQGATT